MGKQGFSASTLPLLVLGWLTVSVSTGALSAPLNVTIRELEANTAIVTWEIVEGDPVIGFAITQQKKDVRMLRYIQEVNTTTRSCALWALEEDTEYIVHVQSISMGGSSPPSDPVSFRTPRESEKLASTGPDEVSREAMEQAVQLRAKNPYTISSTNQHLRDYSTAPPRNPAQPITTAQPEHLQHNDFPSSSFSSLG